MLIHKRKGLHQRFGVGTVKCACGLIRHDKSRLDDECPGAGGALTLTAGKLPRKFRQLLCYLCRLLLLILRLPNRHFLQIQGQNNIFCNGQGVKKIILLKDKAQTVPSKSRQLSLFHFRNIRSFQQNTAGTWSVNSSDDI